jgi:hypothetical protein
LDTIPPEETLLAWKTRDNKPLKELLQHLDSNPGSRHYYDYEQKNTDDTFNFDPAHPYHIRGHHYDMSDHGLFIAGIVHKIAPKANIHIIEVLNQYAIGSTEALIWGLQQIIEHFDQNIPLIINSSLTISFSCDATRAAVEEGRRRPATPVEEFLCLIEHLDRSSVAFSFSRPTEKEYDDITQSFPNAISVAAAGNDNPAEIDGMPAPPSRALARFPAAFGSVIGVGALTREGEIARYSNKPDDPEPEGFYVFGGNVDGKSTDDKWMASKTDGILGVYTHESYPDNGGCNTSGWARWAGTSFASAVVTGILAQVYECHDGLVVPTNSKAAVKLLRDVAEEKKDEGHVLPVGQGKHGLNPHKETISPDLTS